MRDGQYVAAVPELDSYRTQTGIGRVLHNLSLCWDGRVALASAQWEVRRLPLLRREMPLVRNLPYAVRAPAEADLVFLPRLTGAEALADTHGLPSVVIVHDIGVADCALDREGMNWLTYRTILRSFHGLRHATRIIAVSEFTRNRLVAHLPDVAARVTVIPNAVAPVFYEGAMSQDEARMAVAARVGVELGAPLLLSVGSETPRKNVPLLLHVFRQIKDRYPRAQLLKVGRAGGSTWRARTVAAAQAYDLAMGRDVVILEDIDDAALATVYRAADVFMSTSLYEGFGLPAAEALAVGTPVVVTNRTAYPETVAEAAIPEPGQPAMARLVEPEVCAFVAAVLDTLADSAARERNARGAAPARRFTLKDAADGYLRVMAQAVGRGVRA